MWSGRKLCFEAGYGTRRHPIGTEASSLWEMVSGYFRAVCKGKTDRIEAAPVLAEISGVLSSKAEPKKLIAGYHKHIEEKYR